MLAGAAAFGDRGSTCTGGAVGEHPPLPVASLGAAALRGTAPVLLGAARCHWGLLEAQSDGTGQGALRLSQDAEAATGR